VTAPVLVPAATEAEWLAARRQGVTASEIACVMGIAPAEWDSPYSLYHRKLGNLPPKEDSDAMERGRVLEPYIADRFAKLRPEFIVDGDGRRLYAHPGRSWQLATPDRLAWERDNDRFWPGGDYQNLPDAVRETKTDAGGDDDWGDEGTDQIPVHYRCQVLWQMDVMGVTRAYVPMLPMRSWKLRVYEIELDDQARADLRLMRSEARDFLARIEHRTEPGVDWRPQTTAALKHLNPGIEQRDVTVRRQLAISYRAAVRRAAEAEQRKELMTNRMLAAIGTGRRAIEANTGDLVATRSVYPNRRIDTKTLRSGYPGAAAACTVTRNVTKLLPAKTKKDTAP
jgi:putative phage-type endonuclease